MTVTPTGRPRRAVTRALREGFGMAVASRWPSVCIAAAAAIVTVIVLLTVGRSIANERAVVSGFDSAGARQFTLSDPSGLGTITGSDLLWIARMGHVQQVAGFGLTIDLTSTAVSGGNPTPAIVVSSNSTALTLHGPTLAGRSVFVTPGSQRALGLSAPAGSVVSRDGSVYGVAGTFSWPTAPVDLSAYALIVDSDPQVAVQRLIVVVDQAQNVSTVSRLVFQLLGGGDLAIDQPEALEAARSMVTSQVGRYGTQTLLQALIAGLVLGASTVYVYVAVRRREFGLRRALGASRSMLVSLVVIMTITTAIPGVAIGTVAGCIAVTEMTGESLGWAFPLALLTLVTLVFALAALPIAAVAAMRDPVRALRTA